MSHVHDPINVSLIKFAQAPKLDVLRSQNDHPPSTRRRRNFACARNTFGIERLIFFPGLMDSASECAIHSNMIQRLLGHSGVATTMVHTHVFRGDRAVRSPLDSAPVTPRHGLYPATETGPEWRSRFTASVDSSRPLLAGGMAASKSNANRDTPPESAGLSGSKSPSA